MSLLYKTTYDEVPYESYPYSQTHPDRLAVMATLFGLRPAPVSSCRVLEIGCAAGGNLIPLAAAYREGRFLGIDQSGVQVQEGLATIKALALPNIDLRTMDILEVTPELGKFNYILCHGVFSWVPTPVQDKILAICANNLQPNGVAYVSYNTYPGWHMRGLIRDMLAYHVRPFTYPAMKVRQARNFLDFLGKTAGQETGPYALLLQAELESFRHSSDSYLFHEHLEECNDPIYFYQFVERAAAAGLKYLGEADMRSMVPGNFPPEVENVLQMVAQDMIHMEQYMDFIRNRTFRQTLLVLAKQTPSSNLRSELMRQFRIASPARPVPGQEVKIASEDLNQFGTPSGLTLNSGDPIVKAMMLVLEQHWPMPVPLRGVGEGGDGAAGEPGGSEEARRRGHCGSHPVVLRLGFHESHGAMAEPARVHDHGHGEAGGSSAGPVDGSLG
jgi:SAM-dependent methyltransferase